MPAKRKFNASSYRVNKKRKRGQSTFPARSIGYGRFVSDSVEAKYFDLTLGNILTSTSGAIYSVSLNLIAQGAGQSQRVGRKCKAVSLHLKGQVTLDDTNVPSETSDRYRIIVYQDRQCNGASATVSDILAATSIDSFRNLDNSMRFRALYDKTATISALTNVDGGPSTGVVLKHWSMNCKLDMPLEFSSSTSSIANVRSNNIGVMVISAAGTCKFRYRSRLRFVDH